MLKDVLHQRPWRQRLRRPHAAGIGFRDTGTLHCQQATVRSGALLKQNAVTAASLGGPVPYQAQEISWPVIAPARVL